MIAKNMMSIMKENHRNSVWYGDIYLIEKCAIMSGVIKKTSPRYHSMYIECIR